MKIAILITVHNRWAHTSNCLENLFNQDLKNFDVFLTDDGSTDGTKGYLNKLYPNIYLHVGDGTLFWNRGMVTAWSKAIETSNYDFYIWLNNDTYLVNNALSILIETYNNIKSEQNKESIIVGACKEPATKNDFSYGGRDLMGLPIIPNNEIQEVVYINGNIVLIPAQVLKTVGLLNKDYHHGFGDFDYGLRAQKKGITCYTTRDYIAACRSHQEEPACFSEKISLMPRIINLFQPGGFYIRDYDTYLRNHYPKARIFRLFKVLLKVIFPNIYKILKQKK